MGLIFIKISNNFLFNYIDYMDSCIFNLGGKPNTLKNKVLNEIRKKYSLNSIEFTNVAQTVFMSDINDDFDPGFKTWLSRQNLGIKAEYSDSTSKEDANKLFKAIMLYNNKVHPDVNFDENTFNSDNSKKYKYTSYVARNIAFNALTDMICNREFEAYSADPNHDTSNNYNHYKKVIIESIRNNTRNNLIKSGVTTDELKAVLTDIVKNNNNTLGDKEFITCFEILNNKYPSVYVTNLIACYKELTEADDPLAEKLTYRNREKAFKQIFSNPKVNTFIYEKEVKKENTDSEDIPESENTVDEATDDAIDMMMKSHTTVENKDFMDDIDADLVLIFNSLPKLVNASYTKDEKGNKNYEKVRDESIGFIKRTNAREVVQIIKQVGNFKNKQSFIESIRKRANNTNEYAFLAVLADMIEKDDDLFNKIMHCVSMSVISKMEVVVDGDTSETKRSNPKADATSTMIYDLLSTAKYSVIDADLVELNFLTSELNRKFDKDSKNIDSTTKVNYAPMYAKEFYKILNKIYPNIQEIAIKDYLLFADNNFNKTVDSMFSVVKSALNQAKRIQENHINQINEFVEINKTNNKLKQREEAGEFIAKNLYKDAKTVFEGDIITREFKNNTISLAKMLLPYSSVKLELISKNVEGNNVSDIDNASMLTYLNNIFNDEELLNNYAEVIFKNSQYIKSNYLLEQRDDKGNIINAGIFKYDSATGKYKATSYAKKMFKASKVAGASYIDNGSNVLYNAMADFDYIVSSYIAFQKCIDTDTNEETKKLANYFIRIPSDAQNSYFITAPRYDTRDLLGTAEESEEFKNAYAQAIIEAKLDESADIKNAVDLKTDNDKFNDIVTGKIDSINLYDKRIQHLYGGQDIKIQLINKEGFKYIVTGKVVNINNTNSYAITNINRLGTYFDSKTADSNKNLNKLKNIIKKDLISTGSFTTVNRNSKIFTQFRNVFEQELINMAMNIDAIFKTDKGKKEGMVQMIHKNVFDYNENFVNDDRELKFYEVYHKRTNKYKLKDGTTATHKTLVQPVYNKVTDKNGKEYYEIATYEDSGYIKYKLSGRCFESDRFTVYTDEGYRNFGQEVIDNYFDLLGANNFLGYTKDTDGKIVLKLSNEQNQAIDNAIDEFIKALVKSNRDRLINPLKYAKNTDNSFDSIVNYSINYQLMYYNFCDILEGDSKFYKDSQTFLKRAKEMIAGGKPYGIFDLNKFEENAPEDIDDAKLSNTEFVKIDSEGNKTPYSIKARTGFYGVTITNSIKTSENATKDNDDPNSLFSKLKNDYTKLGFSLEDARINANKILDLYQDTKVNDAQSYITFEEFVRRIAAKGQLNRYKPLIDKILDESTPINPDELKEFVQLQKNFYYDLHYDELFNLRRPRQIKNAEFVLIPRFIKGTDLENVYNIMIKFGIDQLNTSETSKAGKNYILDIFDNEGALLNDVKEDLINNTNNSKFFKHAPFAREIYSYNFLYCQLETPQHIKNSLNKFAIQIAKKVFDNINKDNKKLYPIKQRFFKLYGEKIERCANKVFRDLNILDENNLIKLNEYGRLDGLNYEVLLDKFEAELFRTGFDENLLDYVTISESTKLSEVLGAYPKTVMPMSTNIVAPKLESVSQSIMNNSVTRQKIRGYHGGQVTSVGFGNSKAPWELDITSLKKSPSFNEFISKNPNLKSKTQEQRDAYIDNNINKVREDYRKYLTKNNKNFALYSDRLKYHPNGENYVEVLVPRTAVNVNWFDDKGNKKSDEAVLKEIQEAGVDEHIIYRIPTEGKGSICVAKIKGFIDESLGSTIVVPDDWVSQTGSDFDIDSVYSICYKTYIDKNTNTLKKVDYKDNKDINENDWYKYINRELKKLEEDIIPNTLYDDIKTEIENREEKLDELNNNYSKYNRNLNDAFLKCSKPIRGLIINSSKYTAIGTSKRENMIARLTNIINSLKNNVINKKIKGFEDAVNYVEAAQKMIDYLNDSPNVKNEYYENTNNAIIELKAENYDKFDSTAQKYNLASYEEFKNNYYKYASDDAIENGITSCIINIMKDDSVRIENLSPSNFKAIIDARDELMNKVVKEKRNARSPFNILDQAEYHGDAISGMSLKALSVVRDNFCSICNTVEPKLTPSNQVKVFYSKNRYNIDSIVRNFSNEKGTNIQVTDDGVYVTHDRLGWSNNSLNIENMIFTSYSAQTTAHILDNIKEGNIPNVNIYTFQVYKTFPDLGIDYRTCISFMMHPAVEDIVNFYNINNSVFNDSKFNRPIYDTYIKLANEINRYSADNKLNLPVIQVNNIKQDALKNSIEAALVALGKSYDEISTQKEVFSVEKNLAGVNNEFDNIADYFVNYYSTIHQFERLYNTSNKINALTRVLNPDKFGAKKSIFETNQVFESINEIINSEDEPVLTVDGANILEAIYPGIERGTSTEQMINKFLTSNKRDSKYPPLYYFLKYATAPSIKISQAIFPTQSIEFREVVNTLNDILPASAKISYKLNNNFERYITNCIYRNCKISKSNFIVLGENNDFNITYDINTDYTDEEQRIYGFNHPNSVAIQKEYVDDKGETKRFISTFEISDINNPTNEELNDYVKLTPAQKIAWIKSYFTNPGVFDIFEVNLKNSYKTKYNSINSQLIYFNDSTIDVQSVRNELYKLSKSSNPFIKLAVLDLVKYAFVVEGFTMRKNGVSKAISNKILTNNEMLYDDNSIIDDFNSSFDNIVSYYTQSKDIAESFLRGSYNDISSVPKCSVPKVSIVTKFQDISSMNTELKNVLENTDTQKGILNAYNMSHPESIKKSFDKLTDEDKLKTLGYTHQLLFGTNRDVFVDSRDETIIEKYNLDTAPYIVLTVDKKQLLYKVNVLSNGDYYLYPLNKLEKNENNKFSINPDNNTRNVLSKEYYELKKEALDCNGPLPEINNSYIYQKPEPIINNKSVTYEDIKNDEIKNETWNTIVKKFEDSKSTYIENYDNEKMQNSSFRVNSKIIPKAYYFMNNSMHFGRINIIDDGKNKYKIIKINAEKFKNSVKDAKDEFDKQLTRHEKNTHAHINANFRGFLSRYNPSYEKLVYNDFVMFPNTPEVYCMTDYSSETSSNSAIGEDESVIEGVKRNAKAIYDSIIGNSPVERNNKYTLTDYFTDAYLQMVNNSREKNDEIATEIKNELNSHGIIGQATAINKNLLIASEYTATYAVRRFEDFVDRINHFELIDDTFVPATDPRIMDMCKNDSKLRNKVLKLIEDADSFIESFEVPACLKSEDAEVNNYLNEIKECVNGLKNNEDIDKIKSNFIDIYLSRLSDNPLVKLGLINLTDGLYSTSKAEALFHDVKENSNPLIQVILKDVMDDIYKAEMIGKQDANTFDKRFTAILNKGVNFDNFITNDGHFKHKYDNKLVEDRKALKDAMLDTRIKYGKNSKQDIQAKLDYYKFMYENFEQALPDDFYKTRIDAIQKIVDSNVFDVYKEYLDILDEINEINEHYDNGTLPDEYKAKKKRLFAKIEELVSPVIETPNGDVLPKFKYNDVEYTLYDKDSKEKLIYSFEAYKELTELIAKIKSNNENYYKYETKRDFDKKLAHYLSIKEKKEVLDDNGFRILSDEELAQDKEYIEAIEWINKNTIKNIRPEIKDLLNKCYSVFKTDKKDTVNIYSAVKAIAKKKGAVDVNGVINGRELSPAVVESLKRLQSNSKVFSDMNAVTGEGLISTIPKNIVVYNDKYKELFGKVSTLTSSTRAVMNNINAILRPHYNYRNNSVDFAALTGKEIIQLSADYEKLYYSKQKDKENKHTMTSEQYKKFKKYFSRNDNNGYVNSAKSTFVNIANLEKTKYVEEKLKEFKGDKDGDAFKAYEVKVKNDAREYANKIMNAAETILYETIYYRTKEGISEERIPNRYLFDSLSLTDEGRKELVDVEKTNALQIINRYVKTKPTKYWYQTKEEMIEKYGIDSAEYKQWYDRNTILNIRTHKVEPIAIWMQQEINNAGLNEEIKDIAGKYLTKEQLEELEKQIDENNKYKNYAPSIYMQNRKLDKSNKKYIQNGTYDDNIKSTSKYRISNNMSEADKEMYDLMKEYINKYAYSDSAKKHFDKGFLPLEIKNDEDLSWGYIGREIANTVGFIPSTNGDNEFQKVISYSNHKDMAMPMTEILKAPGMKKVKTKKPIISDFSSEQEYLVKLKEYNDEVAAVNAHNKEVTKNVINRDWKSVFKNFIVEGAHYNAVNNNKYMLFFGLDTLRNQDYLVQNTGWKGLKPLKNKSTEDRDVYETKKDNFVTQQYETITRRLLYEQYKEANKRYTQFANVLQQIQSSKFMMFNVTGGIANVTVGTIGILGEALGKEFFDAKEFAQGARIYDSHILNYLANMYSDKSDCLEDAILKFFYIIEFDNIKGTVHMPDNLNTVFSKLRELSYGMQTGGEHMMQGSALFTILTNHRLFKDEDGHYVAKSLTDAKKDLRYSVLKEILSDEKLKQFTEFINYNTRNLNAKKDYAHFRYDLATDFLMYKCNNEEKETFRKTLKLKEKEITDEFNDDNLHPTIFSQLALNAEGTMGFAKDSILDKLTDDEKYKILGSIKNKTISINNKIHGVYDKLGAATIEQHWLGGVLMQYHKHLPMGILKRYRRQGYFNEFRGTVEKGMYNSIIDFLKMNHRELKHKAEDDGYNENQIVAIRSVKQILKNYTTMIGNFRLYYDLMPEYDRANMQRALAGACGVLSALFLTIAMKYVSDLDDEDYKEDDNWFLHRVSALCIYEADRLASESWMYSPIGMINEGKKLWNSPTAANSTLEDMWKGIKLMGEIVNPFTDFEPVYKGGPNSGENKFKVIAERQIPIYRNVKRLIDLPKNNHYFKLDTNIIGMVPDEWVKPNK